MGDSDNQTAITGAGHTLNPRLDFYDRAYPPAMRLAEVACIKQRRSVAGKGEYHPIDPDVPCVERTGASVPLPDDTVGLALSGGGIRSATFCLGVLQALAQHGVLRRIDFLSTVSGGGYIGAFLGALIQRREPIEPGGPTGILRAEADLSEPSSQPVRWLREHGRYMSPNGAGDEVTAAAVYLRNFVAVHVALATCLLAAMAATTLLRAWAGRRWPALVPAWQTGLIWWSPYFALPMAVLVVTSMPLGWAYWFVQGNRPFWSEDEKRKWADWVAPVTAVLIAVLSMAVFWLSTLSLEPVRWAVYFTTALPLGALVAWIAAQVYAWKQGSSEVEIFTRAKLSQWLAVTLVATAATGAYALIDSLGQTLYLHLSSDGWSSKGAGMAGVIGALITLVVRLAPLLTNRSTHKRLSVSSSVIAGILATVVVGGILVSISTLVYAVAFQGHVPACAKGPVPGGASVVSMNVRWLTWFTLGTAVLTVLFGLTMRFVNNSSHQALYANRLTRAYLGASNPGRFDPNNLDGQKLSDPIRGDNIGWGLYHPFETGGPLHIVNVTLNETVSGTSQVEERDRKGLPMAVGPCGLSGGVESHAQWRQRCEATRDMSWRGHLPDDSTDWIRPIPRAAASFHMFANDSMQPHTVEALSVGTWTAISGAAFTTGLGARTNLALSLLLGVANVRLGYWWDSYVWPGDRRGCRTKPTIRHRVGEALNVILPVQTHLFQELTAHFFGPNRRRWYLSDGGHFENTACYELIRRRVPFIIACDDGRDPAYAFEDLGNLVRKARNDFAADIRFLSRSDLETRVGSHCRGVIGGLDDFRTFPDGERSTGLKQEYARAYALLADVYYEGSSTPGSVILVLKPSVMGSEPLDILQYRHQHSAFPQEPTTDQYFDEAQWESYRALGEHIGNTVFRVPSRPGAWSPASFTRL